MINKIFPFSMAVIMSFLTGCGGGDAPINSSNIFQSGDTWRGLEYKTIISPNVYTHGINVTINGVTKTYRAGTQRVWLDRNLGASRACTSYDDTACYGDYYQWGRNTDGHEKSNSATTSIQAMSILDLNNSGEFIINLNIMSGDWTSMDSNGTLRSTNWLKTDGTSICPIGYRVPTIDELKAETIDLAGANNVQSRDDAFLNNFLKLPSTSGYRKADSGFMGSVGSWGYVWSSSANGSCSRYLYFNEYWYSYCDNRAFGRPIRCVRH